ncbi:MAG: SDR family oxidoreductase, partial [Anaerolineales bacterium]|nr:SDR family oxidoreductase [Anaerolineales bacterium]
AQVVINSRSQDSLLAAADALTQESGAQVFAAAGDVADPEFPAKLVEEAVAKLGGLDILITNAGGPPTGAFEAHAEATWEKAIDLSFMSHVRLIRAALPHLRQSDAPSVLTITSISVKQPIDNLILSNSVRAATVGLTKSLSLEIGAGIRFNSILPGWTMTDRVTHLLETRAEGNNTSLETEAQKIAASIPLGRLGEPAEFANVAVFLVSPAASYLNGVMLQVDGGGYQGLL